MADDFKPPAGYKKMETAPIWDYKSEPTLSGVFVNAEGDVGPNHSNLYTFRLKDGSLMSIWGNLILDSRFKNLIVGEKVVIHYLGKFDSEKVKGREYHNFDIYREEIPPDQTYDDNIS